MAKEAPTPNTFTIDLEAIPAHAVATQPPTPGEFEFRGMAKVAAHGRSKALTSLDDSLKTLSALEERAEVVGGGAVDAHSSSLEAFEQRKMHHVQQIMEELAYVPYALSAQSFKITNGTILDPANQLPKYKASFANLTESGGVSDEAKHYLQALAGLDSVHNTPGSVAAQAALDLIEGKTPKEVQFNIDANAQKYYHDITSKDHDRSTVVVNYKSERLKFETPDAFKSWAEGNPTAEKPEDRQPKLTGEQVGAIVMYRHSQGPGIGLMSEYVASNNNGMPAADIPHVQGVVNIDGDSVKMNYQYSSILLKVPDSGTTDDYDRAIISTTSFDFSNLKGEKYRVGLSTNSVKPQITVTQSHSASKTMSPGEPFTLSVPDAICTTAQLTTAQHVESYVDNFTKNIESLEVPAQGGIENIYSLNNIRGTSGIDVDLLLKTARETLPEEIQNKAIASAVVKFTKPGIEQDKLTQEVINHTSAEQRPELVAAIAKKQNISVQESIGLAVSSCSRDGNLDLEQAAQAIKAIAEHVKDPAIKAQMQKNPKRIVMHASKDNNVALQNEGSWLSRMANKISNKIRGNPLKGLEVTKPIAPSSPTLPASPPQDKGVTAAQPEAAASPPQEKGVTTAQPKATARPLTQKEEKRATRRAEMDALLKERPELKSHRKKAQRILHVRRIKSGLQAQQSGRGATSAVRAAGHAKGKGQGAGIS